MFFITAIASNQKQLNFNQMMICPSCGKYCRVEVFMVYMYFSLFFIPIFKWDKRFYVKVNCCNNIYTISKALGLAIRQGDSVILKESDLDEVQGRQNDFVEKCPKCGLIINGPFNYCPNCATPLY